MARKVFKFLDECHYVITKTGKQGEGEWEIVDYRANKITVETDSKNNKFLVLSESHYLGWKAYLDGKRVKIYKTNGVLKGIFIPEGEHLVRFVYDPLSFKVRFFISLFSVLSIIGLLGHKLVRRLRDTN